MTSSLSALACLVALAWTTAAGAAETACRVIGSMKFEVGKTVCIANMRSNWLVCTAATAPTGGGAWKDTGVPCNQPRPQSPADYRPVPEGPHPATPPAEVKRTIDMFRGIVFRCEPSTHLSWSGDACAKIAVEFAADAKAAGVAVPVVVVDAADDAAAKAKKVEAAGFKLDAAIDWVVQLRATESGGAAFTEDINGVMEVVPGIYDWKPLLIASDAYPAGADQALAEAKIDFPGELEFLTRPR